MSRFVGNYVELLIGVVANDYNQAKSYAKQLCGGKPKHVLTKMLVRGHHPVVVKTTALELNSSDPELADIDHLVILIDDRPGQRHRLKDALLHLGTELKKHDKNLSQLSGVVVYANTQKVVESVDLCRELGVSHFKFTRDVTAGLIGQLEVKSDQLFEAMSDQVVLGQAFAFIPKSAYGTPLVQQFLDSLGLELPDKNVVKSLLGSKAISVPGGRIVPRAFEELELVSLTSDKMLYNAGRDRAHLLVLSPIHPNGPGSLVIDRNGQLYQKLPFIFDSQGMFVATLSDLPVGAYTVCLEGHEEQNLEFQVAEYSLAPLTAKFSHQNLEGSQLNFKIELETFGIPVEGRVRADLREAGVVLQSVTIDALSGTIAGSLSLSGAGPHDVQLTVEADPSKIAVLPLRGSRQSERELTLMSALGYERHCSLIPGEETDEVRGLHVREGGMRNTPVRLVEAHDDVAVVKFLSKDVETLSIVVWDMATGDCRNESVNQPKSGDSFSFNIDGPLALILIGAFVDGKTWEGWTTFVRSSDLALTIQTPENAKPGDTVNIDIEAGSAEHPASVYLVVKDDRLLTQDTPASRLASALKAAIDEQTPTLSIGQTKRSLRDYRNVKSPTWEAANSQLKEIAEKTMPNPPGGWGGRGPSQIPSGRYRGAPTFSAPPPSPSFGGSRDPFGLSGPPTGDPFSAPPPGVPRGDPFGLSDPGDPFAAPSASDPFSPPPQSLVGGDPFAAPPAGAFASPNSSGSSFGEAPNENDYSVDELSIFSFDEEDDAPTEAIPSARLIDVVNADRHGASEVSLHAEPLDEEGSAPAADPDPEDEVEKPVGRTPSLAPLKVNKEKAPPEVIFADCIEVKGKTSHPLTLGPGLSRYIVEAFAMRGFDWNSTEARFQSMQDPYVEVTLPPFLGEMDAHLGVVHVGCAIGDFYLKIKKDGNDVKAVLGDRPVISDIALPRGQHEIHFMATPGLFEFEVNCVSTGESASVTRRINQPGKLVERVQQMVILKEGESFERTKDVLNLIVLPGIEKPFKQLMSATSNYGHKCCEQTAAKMLSSVAAYLFAGDNPKQKKDAEDSIVTGVVRLQTMWHRNKGFTMYPESKGIDTYWGPKATVHLFEFEVLNGLRDLSPALKIAVETALEMAKDTAAPYRIERFPGEANSPRDCYRILRSSHSVDRVKEHAFDKLKSLFTVREMEIELAAQSRGKVEQRADLCYIAAALITSQKASREELAQCVSVTNRIMSSLDASGRLYSTVDSVALVALMSELNKAGLLSPDGSDVVINGAAMKSSQLATLKGEIETIQVAKGLLPLEVTKNTVQSWDSFESNLEFSLVLEKNGQPTRKLKIGDSVELVCKLSNGYKPGDILHVCLPPSLSRIYGGGQVKQFSVDFAGRSEVRVNLVATAVTVHRKGKKLGSQSYAAIVRNMFEEERIGNPGPLDIKVSPQVEGTDSDVLKGFANFF
ncbi:MAG: hypothetical protein P1V97_15710 [Planctomycetota bacterium]|nr:hypothetical protein [Planctomycetota bacterium]